MKFEFEKIDVAFIQRRVLQEQEQSNGRRVTRVVLTPREWAEFMVEWLSPQRYYELGRLPQYVRVQIPMPIRISYDTNINDTVHIVDVVRGS